MFNTQHGEINQFTHDDVNVVGDTLKTGVDKANRFIIENQEAIEHTVNLASYIPGPDNFGMKLFGGAKLSWNYANKAFDSAKFNAFVNREGGIISREKRVFERNLAAGKLHKNNLEYKGETHVYKIYDEKDSTHKIGQSAMGVRKDGK